jgi:hypothetical protein
VCLFLIFKMEDGVDWIEGSRDLHSWMSLNISNTLWNVA